MQLAEDVTGSTGRAVQRAILQVLRGKEPASTLRELIHRELPELSSKLQQVFRDNHARALAISRTETGRANNGARFVQFSEAGIQRIRWRTSRDIAVRELHAKLEGEEVLLGQTFSNGLRYPHDPRGPARQTVNCRCDFDAVLEDDDEEDDLDED